MNETETVIEIDPNRATRNAKRNETGNKRQFCACSSRQDESARGHFHIKNTLIKLKHSYYFQFREKSRDRERTKDRSERSERGGGGGGSDHRSERRERRSSRDRSDRTSKSHDRDRERDRGERRKRRHSRSRSKERRSSRDRERGERRRAATSTDGTTNNSVDSGGGGGGGSHQSSSGSTKFAGHATGFGIPPVGLIGNVARMGGIAAGAGLMGSGEQHFPRPLLKPPEIMPLMALKIEESKLDLTQAILDAVAASTRMASSKNFADIFNCNSNSNDSMGLEPDSDLSEF